MAVSLTTQLRQAEGNTNERVQNAYCYGSPSVDYAPNASSSVDPFSGKTNKYAESKIVAITTLTKACHFKWSAAGTACTTNDAVIPADTTQFFVVDASYPYLRLIENAATAVVRVTEIY